MFDSPPASDDANTTPQGADGAEPGNNDEAGADAGAADEALREELKNLQVLVRAEIEANKAAQAKQIEEMRAELVAANAKQIEEMRADLEAKQTEEIKGLKDELESQALELEKALATIALQGQEIAAMGASDPGRRDEPDALHAGFEQPSSADEHNEEPPPSPLPA